MQSLDGVKWYKKRLPEDILKKYRDGIEAEKNIKWINLIPHHPLYYTDFPDLKKIICRADNWDVCFKNIFGPRKIIIESLLSEIEPIRNCIAHNRKLSRNNLLVLKGTFHKIYSLLGKRQFLDLFSKCSMAMDIKQRMNCLKVEAENLFKRLANFEALNAFPEWEEIQKIWWFDELYLGHELHGIVDFFKALKQYALLQRKRGYGHKIEMWMKENGLEEKYKKALGEFQVILPDAGGRNGL